MGRLIGAVVLASAVALSGCYHAVIDTGRAATGTPIVTPWAHSFIYGIVPPKITETAQSCPGGVAKVETQHSFLNGLVAALTGGIYTPMTITVSCAGARAESGTQLKVGTDDPSRVMNKAVELARSSEAPVLVKF
mgnify:CR=1 FL=1